MSPCLSVEANQQMQKHSGVNSPPGRHMVLSKAPHKMVGRWERVLLITNITGRFFCEAIKQMLNLLKTIREEVILKWSHRYMQQMENHNYNYTAGTNYFPSLAINSWIIKKKEKKNVKPTSVLKWENANPSFLPGSGRLRACHEGDFPCCSGPALRR